jgi:hypothetical protein
MPATTILNKQQYHERDIVTVANTGIRKRLVKGRWRCVCSSVDCEKQAQKDGLCAEHRTLNRLQQNVTRSVVASNEPPVNIIVEENEITVLNAINATSNTGNITEQNILHTHGEN